MHQREPRCLKILMIKYGVAVEERDGKEYFNFDKFDLAGFRKNAIKDLMEIRKSLPGDGGSKWNFQGNPLCQKSEQDFFSRLEAQGEIDNRTLDSIKQGYNCYNQGWNAGCELVFKICSGEFDAPDLPK
jgi:hypothetical protein